MNPVRIQRKRTKGWRLPANAVYVGRPTLWGNPWTIAGAIQHEFAETESEARAWCIGMFAEWLTDPEATWSYGADQARKITDRLGTLEGKDLACWCPPKVPCHADVLLRLANPLMLADLITADVLRRSA